MTATRKLLFEKLDGIEATMAELFKQQNECVRLMDAIGSELDALQLCPKCSGDLQNESESAFICDDCQTVFQYESEIKALYEIAIA